MPNDEKHISDLPIEVITHITSYLEPANWEGEIKVIGNNTTTE